MEGKIAWLIVLSFFILAQSLYMALKIIRERSAGKKETTENPDHGERIKGLEVKVEEMEKDNEKDHGLIRGDIRKIFNLINGMRKR